jgi:Protein of unknown function (DUF3592)
VLTIWRWPTLSWHARDIVLALLGAAVILAFVIHALSVRALLHSGARAEGTVVKVETDSDYGGDDSSPPASSPVVEFTTGNGRKVVFTGSLGSSRAPKVGTAVPVRYRPDDPGKAEIDQPVMWLGQPSLEGWWGGVVRGSGHRVQPRVVAHASSAVPCCVRAILSKITTVASRGNACSAPYLLTAERIIVASGPRQVTGRRPGCESAWPRRAVARDQLAAGD